MRAFWRKYNNEMMAKEAVKEGSNMNIYMSKNRGFLILRMLSYLDDWKLEEWASYFTSEGNYLIPPIGNPDADFKRSLYLVHDDHARLEQRAKRLLKKEAHVEYPHSTAVR